MTVPCFRCLPNGSRTWGTCPSWMWAAVLAGFARALALGGFLLLAFQMGDAERRNDRAYRHDVSMDAYLLDPETIGKLLVDAGVEVEATLIREPDHDELTRQAYLVARKK